MREMRTEKAFGKISGGKGVVETRRPELRGSIKQGIFNKLNNHYTYPELAGGWIQDLSVYRLL